MQFTVKGCRKWWNSGWFLFVTMVTLLVDARNTRLSAQSPLCNYVCQCNFKTFSVNCSHANLNSVPGAIPVDIKVLSLANNKIRNIRSSDFSGLNQITKLILASNEIMIIQQGAFKDMYRLQYLNLNDNRLISIPSGIFQHLPSLERIELRNNSIEEIKRDAFLFLPNLKEIQMEKNPLKCNCEMRGFIEYIKRYDKKSVSLGGICKLNKKPLRDMPLYEFGDCRDTRIFEENLICKTCIDKKCHSEKNSHCHGIEPVCMNRVTMAGFTLQSEKTCSTYENCVEAESNNVINCKGWNNGTSCVSCCVQNFCNKYDFAGWTHTFNLELKFKMKKDFSDLLLLPNSDEYKILSRNIKTLLEKELLNQNGTFSVILQSFSLPSITVNLKIMCTAPIHIDELQIWHNIMKVLKTARNLEQLRIDPPTIRLTGKMLCIGEKIDDEKGEFSWPTAKVGMEIQLPCLSNMQNATRKCIMRRRKRRPENESDESTEEPIHSSNAVWAKLDSSKCLPDDWITRELQHLDHEDVDDDSIEMQSARLLNISMNAIFFKQIDIELSVQILQRIIPHVSNLTTQLTTGNVLPILNNMINSPEESLVQAEQTKFSANQLLEMADSICEKMHLEKSDLSASYSNMDVGIVRATPQKFQGATFFMNIEKKNGFMKQTMKVISKRLPIQNEYDGDEVSISLPETLFDNLDEKKSFDISRITFILFKQDKLFMAIAKAAKGSKNTNNFSSFGSKTSSHILQRINSQVLAATVPGVHFTNLKDPVTMRFFHLSKNATNPQCVFWQDSPSTVPHWSTEGCSVLYNVPGKLTVCECIHLTNFALLMDIYNSGDPVDPKHSKALSMLSFIGCGISFVALLITIVTYLGFRKLRSGAVSHILISLCMALAASNLIFVVGMQPYTLSEIVACKVVAVLLHYTLLASMMWMAIEAVHIYLAMVVVFRTYLSHFIIRCSVFAWGLPLGIVVLTLGINTTENYTLKGKICWLSQSAFYASFLFPISVVLLFNVSIFCIIIWRLLAIQKIKKHEHNRKKIRLIGIIGVFFLLGLTWTMAFLAVGEAGIIFSYLFTIFNSLQGLFIFVFYCLYKKESRENLMQLFCCLQKSEKSEKFNTKFSAEVKDPNKNKDVRSRKAYNSESNANGTESSHAGFINDNVMTKL